MVRRRQPRLGEFIADILFQALQFRHVADGQDVLGPTVHEEKVRIGDERIRRPLENRLVERWARPFGPVGKDVAHVLRRHRNPQEGRSPFIDVGNGAALGIEDDAVCDVG